MSSPPALSPPPPGSHKRRISLPMNHLSNKKPKHTPTPSTSRKNSTVSTSHPLRQTSFPPPESAADQAYSPGSPSVVSVASTARRGGGGRKDDDTVSVVRDSGKVGIDLEEDEDEGRDDYGTETVLADGGAGGFAEDDAEKRKLAILLEAFDDEQNARYEAFRRANLNKAAVKKLANQVLSQSVTANVGTVICGFSKVFTGEIIELALLIQKSWGDKGPLLPDHLREAWRRYRVETHGAVGFRGAVGGGSPSATGGGPGLGSEIGGGVGRLFR